MAIGAGQSGAENAAMTGTERPSGGRARNDPKGRTSRDEGLLREVRGLLSRDQPTAERLRRLERMEQTARVWVNGRELGEDRFGYLAEVHD
jgi:hypothetical protein